MISNLPSDRAVQLEGIPLGTTRTITNVGNTTIYYGRDSNVSSSHNSGSLAPGASVTITYAPYLFSSRGQGQIDDQMQTGIAEQDPQTGAVASNEIGLSVVSGQSSDVFGRTEVLARGDGGAVGLRDIVSVKDAPFNGKCDAVQIRGTINATSAVFTPFGTGTFPASSVGKLIVVPGAGVAGAPLATTIQSVGGGVPTLAAAASTTATNVAAVYGTDDTVAWLTAIASGAAAILQPGFSLIRSSLWCPAFTAILGLAWGYAGFFGHPDIGAGNAILENTWPAAGADNYWSPYPAGQFPVNSSMGIRHQCLILDGIQPGAGLIGRRNSWATTAFSGHNQGSRGNVVDQVMVRNCDLGAWQVGDQGDRWGTGFLWNNNIGMVCSDNAQLGSYDLVDARFNYKWGIVLCSVLTAGSGVSSLDTIYSQHFKRLHCEFNNPNRDVPYGGYLAANAPSRLFESPGIYNGGGLLLDGAAYNDFDVFKAESNGGDFIQIDQGYCPNGGTPTTIRPDGNTFDGGRCNGTVASTTPHMLNLNYGSRNEFRMDTWDAGASTAGILIASRVTNTRFRGGSTPPAKVTDNSPSSRWDTLDAIGVDRIDNPNGVIINAVNGLKNSAGQTYPLAGPGLGQAGFVVPQLRAGAAASNGLSASRSYFLRCFTDRAYNIIEIAFFLTVNAGANDLVDVGIFSAAGACLASASNQNAGVAISGKVNAGAAGLSIVPIVYSLAGGTVYYIALGYGVAGGAAPSILTMAPTADGLETLFGTGVGKLEWTVNQGAAGNNIPFVVGTSTVPAISTATQYPILSVRES